MVLSNWTKHLLRLLQVEFLLYLSTSYYCIFYSIQFGLQAIKSSVVLLQHNFEKAVLSRSVAATSVSDSVTSKLFGKTDFKATIKFTQNFNVKRFVILLIDFQVGWCSVDTQSRVLFRCRG